MQLELFANPQRNERGAYRLVVVLQSDISGGNRRIVAPLLLRRHGQPAAAHRTTPAVLHDGEDHLVMLTLLGTVPAAALRKSLGSLAAWRDEITAALDWVLPGV